MKIYDIEGIGLCYINLYPVVFMNAGFESNVRFKKFQMADLIRQIYKKLSFLFGSCYSQTVTDQTPPVKTRTTRRTKTQPKWQISLN